MIASQRKLVVAGLIGNVLEWYSSLHPTASLYSPHSSGVPVLNSTRAFSSKAESARSTL
jgi:hypothetical protein